MKGCILAFIMFSVICCASPDTVPGPKLQVPPPRFGPVIQTEILYCIDINVNVHGGPGKNYKAIDKLYLFDEIVVEKKTYNGWRKIIFKDLKYGFVLSNLIGTVQQAETSFCIEVSKDILVLMDAGIIKRVEKEDIFVNGTLWFDIPSNVRKIFMLNFALKDFYENNKGVCSIFNDLNGTRGMRLESYVLATNTYY